MNHIQEMAIRARNFFSNPNKEKQVSSKGENLHLGYLGNKRIGLPGHGSVLVTGMPGSGKTTGMVIPSILKSDSCSILVNDLNGDLWNATSGYRSTLGPCYRLDWIRSDKDGELNPSFNFLDSRIIPSEAEDRYAWIELIAESLVPSNPNIDWQITDRIRSALTGFLHGYLWDHEAHRGDPSMGGMVKWLYELAAKANPDDKDPMATVIKNLYEQQGSHWPDRFRNQIGNLFNIDEKERSGILGSVSESLLPFKNEIVIERTGTTDFTPGDLRGRLTERSWRRMGFSGYPNTKAEWDFVALNPLKQEWLPVSIYLCTHIAAERHHRSLNSLFLECCFKHMLGHLPDQQTADGTLLGPFGINTFLENFTRLQRMESLPMAPSYATETSTSWILTANSRSQIQKVYSDEDCIVLDTTIPVKIDQNSMASCSVERTQMISDSNRNEKPFSVDVPFFSGHPRMQEKVHNSETGRGPDPAPPMPILVPKE